MSPEKRTHASPIRRIQNPLIIEQPSRMIPSNTSRLGTSLPSIHFSKPNNTQNTPSPMAQMYGTSRNDEDAESVQSSSSQLCPVNSPALSHRLTKTIPHIHKEHDVTLSGRIRYYVPCCNWMTNYTASDLGHDFIAGISLASYQIPLCMSFATAVAHVPTICGLLSLSIAPIVYMFLGTVPQMIVGPEAAVSMIVGQCIEKTVKHNPDVLPVDLLIVLASGSGAILLAFGLLRFGYIDNILCSALLKAFISAIGITMVINSTISILGLDTVLKQLPSSIHVHSPYQKLVFLVKYFKEFNTSTTVVGFTAFACLFFLKLLKTRCVKHKVRFASFFPEILIVVIASIILSGIFDFEHHGIDVVGEVDTSGFSFKAPFTASLRPWYSDLFFASFVCAILGFFESSTAGKSLSSSTMPVSSNRELVALGSVGLTVSLFGGLPSFGGYARSKLNATNGARTPASGLFMGIATLLVTFYLMDYVKYLPICVLNAVIGIVGLSLLQESPKEIKFHIRNKGYNELFTFAITLLAAFFYSIEVGVGLGTFYSLMRVIKHSTQSRIQILARVAGTDTFVNSDFVDSRESIPLLPKSVIVRGYKEFRRQSMIDRGISSSSLEAVLKSDDIGNSGSVHSKQQPASSENTLQDDSSSETELEDREGCLIIKIPEPLTFTNASDLKSRLKRIELYGSASAHPGSKHTNFHLRHIVFDLNGMTSLDSSAAQILDGITESYRNRHIDVFFCRVFRNEKLLKRLQDSGISSLLTDTEGIRFGIPQHHPPYYDSILDALKAIDFLEYGSMVDTGSYLSGGAPYDGSA